MVSEHVLAAAQVTAGGKVALTALATVFLAAGLFLAVSPRRAARPPAWQYKNRPEPSDFTVDLVRIGGIVWTAAAVAMIVAVAAA